MNKLNIYRAFFRHFQTPLSPSGLPPDLERLADAQDALHVVLVLAEVDQPEVAVHPAGQLGERDAVPGDGLHAHRAVGIFRVGHGAGVFVDVFVHDVVVKTCVVFLWENVG